MIQEAKEIQEAQANIVVNGDDSVSEKIHHHDTQFRNIKMNENHIWLSYFITFR